MCAWCGSVWLSGWVPRAEAVERLGAKRVERADSHGICDACLEAELELLAASRRRAA
jgi:hypothetical protein